MTPTMTPSMAVALTVNPTHQPSMATTMSPTTSPTDVVPFSSSPSVAPTVNPIHQPSMAPTMTITQSVIHRENLEPAPLLSMARFSNDGSFLYLVFDKPTDRANTSLSFPCISLFKFSCADESRCEWDNSAKVSAFPPNKDDCVSVGDFMMLQENSKLRAQCTQPTNCTSLSSWPTSDVSVVAYVLPPVNPVHPQIIMSVPTLLGSCSSLTVDASSSTGNAGRSWTYLRMTVNCTEIIGNDAQFCDATALQSWLDSHFRMSPPPIIPSDYFISGRNYTFILTLCNVFGKCSVANRLVSVVSTMVPSVFIPGSDLRTIKRRQSLSLTAVASIAKCSSKNETIALQYRWSVFRNNTQLSQLVSTSKDPSRFLLPGFALDFGLSFLIEVDVSVSFSSHSASASASVEVRILRGEVIARLARGTNTRTMMRPSESLQLDGSPSYDEDEFGVYGKQAGLSFYWSCKQLFPVWNSSCFSVVEANSFTSSMSDEIVRIVALPSSANSIFAVTLSVSTIDGRTNSLFTNVEVLSALTPVIALSSNAVGTMINRDKSVQIIGAVNVPANVSGELSWTSDLLSQDMLASITLSSLSKSVSAVPTTQSISINLILTKNALLGGVTYSFVLNFIAPTSSSSTQNAISIQINAPPSPGSFAVTPLYQQELSSPFTFFCDNWQDTELPLSYAFGYFSAANTKLTVRSRSELTFASLSLPKGSPSKNYTLEVTADVYDSLSAVSLSTFFVQIWPQSSGSLSSATLESTLSDIMTMGSTSAGPNVDEIKQQAAIVGSLLNTVDCSRAPNCSALRRQDCARTSHTCGPCFSPELLGDNGDSNNPCVSIDSLTNKIEDSPSQKTCPGNCSSHGRCIFRSLSNHLIVPQCSLYSFDCVSECFCQDGFKGSSYCEISDNELEMRYRLRDQLVSNVLSLSTLEDDSEASLEERINTMNEVTLKSDELSLNATSLMLLFVNQTLETIISRTFDASSGLSLLPTISTIASTVQRRSLQIASEDRRRTTMTSTGGTVNAEDVEMALQSFGQLYASSMAMDQYPQSWLHDTFTLQVQQVASTERGIGSTCDLNSSIVLPQSAREKALGTPPQSLTIPSCSSNALSTSVSTLSLSASLFEEGLTFRSNPLSVRLSDIPCDPSNLDSCNVTLLLPWTGTPISNLHESQAINRTISVVTCEAGQLGDVVYSCTDIGQNVTISCNGTWAQVEVICPQLFDRPQCEALFVDFEERPICSPATFTDKTLACTCSLQPQYRRMLQLDDNSTFYLNPTLQVAVVGILKSTASSFTATVLSADDLSVDVAETGGPVIGTLGGFLFVVIIGMGLGAYWDEQDRSKKCTSKDKKSLLVLNDPAAPGNGGHPTLRNKPVNNIVSLLDRSLPLFLRAQSLTTRATTAIRQHHRWIQVYFVHSAKLGRLLRVFSLATNTVIMLFAQSVFYNLTQGDDGSCSAMHDEKECVELASTYGGSASQCFWNTSTEQCEYIEPDSSIQMMFFVAVLSSVLSVPLAMLSDWLIVQILAAPTRYDPWRWSWSSKRQVVDDRNLVQRRNSIFLLQNVFKTAVHPSTASHHQLIGDVPKWDAQSSMREMISSLENYRLTLTEKERHSFDELWGIGKNGRFEDSHASSFQSFAEKVSACVSPQRQRNKISDRILADINKAISTAAQEIADFHVNNVAETDRNERILYHFQTDLLVGLAEETIAAQDRREHFRVQPRSEWTQRITWAFLIGLDLGMLFYLFLFGVSQDSPRQRGWVKSFAIWLLMEIVFYSSLVTLISHVLIPSLLLRNAAAIKQRMFASLAKCRRELQYQTESCSIARSHQRSSSSFNAANYLYVSHYLAKTYPNLRASQLVLAYQTPWPKESYRRMNERSSESYAMMTFTADAFIGISLFLVTTFLKLPNQSQDVLLQLVVSISLAYVVNWHLSLYDIHPSLVVIPGLVCAIVAHFAYLMLGGKNEAVILQAMPLTNTKNKSDQEYLSDDNWSLSSGESLAIETDQEAKKHDGMLNRRQSIQSGIRMLEREVHLDKVHNSDCDFDSFLDDNVNNVGMDHGGART